MAKVNAAIFTDNPRQFVLFYVILKWGMLRDEGFKFLSEDLSIE